MRNPGKQQDIGVGERTASVSMLNTRGQLVVVLLIKKVVKTNRLK